MRCLALDPGASSGWAIYEDGLLTDCGACAPPGPTTWGQIDRVLAEKPRKYPHDAVDPNNLITLADSMGRILGPLEQRGAVVVTVHPQDWKGQTPKEVSWGRAEARLTKAELALYESRARSLRGKAVGDMKDAVALGQFAIAAGLWPAARKTLK